MRSIAATIRAPSAAQMCSYSRTAAAKSSEAGTNRSSTLVCGAAGCGAAASVHVVRIATLRMRTAIYCGLTPRYEPPALTQCQNSFGFFWIAVEQALGLGAVVVQVGEGAVLDAAGIVVGVHRHRLVERLAGLGPLAGLGIDPADAEPVAALDLLAGGHAVEESAGPWPCRRPDTTRGRPRCAPSSPAPPAPAPRRGASSRRRARCLRRSRDRRPASSPGRGRPASGHRRRNRRRRPPTRETSS